MKMLLVDRVGIQVALVVSLTLFLAVIVAKIVGSMLPMIAKKIGMDPAVISNFRSSKIGIIKQRRYTHSITGLNSTCYIIFLTGANEEGAALLCIIESIGDGFACFIGD